MHSFLANVVCLSMIACGALQKLVEIRNASRKNKYNTNRQIISSLQRKVMDLMNA